MTLDGVTLTDSLIRWSPNEWPSACREIPVYADRMFLTSNKSAQWTPHIYVYIYKQRRYSCWIKFSVCRIEFSACTVVSWLHLVVKIAQMHRLQYTAIIWRKDLLLESSSFPGSRDSSDGIANEAQAGRPKRSASNSGRYKWFFCSPKRRDQLWGPRSPIFSWYRDLIPLGYSVRSVELTAHLHLISRLRTVELLHPPSPILLLGDSAVIPSGVYKMSINPIIQSEPRLIVTPTRDKNIKYVKFLRLLFEACFNVSRIL
jgi:hypothetical protein